MKNRRYTLSRETFDVRGRRNLDPRAAIAPDKSDVGRVDVLTEHACTGINKIRSDNDPVV